MLLEFISLIAFLSTMPPSVGYGQPSAALWEDQLFVTTNLSRSPDSGVLYRVTFAPTRRGIPDPIEHSNPMWWGQNSSQAKLDIRDDRLLLLQGGGVHFIFPMAEVPLLESSKFGDKVLKLRGYRDYYFFVSLFSGGDAELLFPDHRDHDVPVESVGVGDLPEWRYLQAGRYSLQIAGPKSVRLFHAHKDKLFVSIEPDYLCTWYVDKDGHVVKNLPKPPDRQLRTGKLPADFTERFAVYTAGGKDYLVTNNGKVYMAVPKGKAEVEVTALWTDPEQRIRGVVQDLANDAAYGWGFAGRRGSADRFYVKLDPKPTARAYKLTVPLRDECSDAYLESYECARAFRTAPKK